MTNYKNLLGKIVYVVISAMVLCNGANASILHVKNEDSARIDVIIEPGDGKIITDKNHSQKFKIEPNEEKKVTVNDFDKETFSVTGKVTMPSIYNKCGPLLISKNYKIIFTGAKLGGTICIAQPIDE